MSCTHENVRAREAMPEDSYEVDGVLHTVVYLVCNNPFCELYGKTVRVRHTNDNGTRQFRMPPTFPPPRIKP